MPSFRGKIIILAEKKWSQHVYETKFFIACSLRFSTQCCEIIYHKLCKEISFVWFKVCHK